MCHKVQETPHPLSQRFGLASLLRFALPTILAMVFMGLYTLVDALFVSRYGSTRALSALNLVCPVINLIVGFGTMLATGASALIARKMGAGEGKRAAQDFTLVVIAGLLSGLAIAFWGTFFLSPLLRGLGADEALFPYCKAYLYPLLLFTPASILQVLFQNLLVTAGRPGLGMALGIGAGAVNLLFDSLFMVSLRMGIRGAALGTGLGYLFSAVAGALYFGRAKGPLRFRKPVPDASVLAESCFNGLSEMVSQGAAAVTTFLFNRAMMQLLGETGVAAITILIYTQFLLSTLFIGFSMGVAPVISYAYGKKDCAQLKRLFSLCMRFLFFTSILVFGAALASGPALAGIFAAKGSPVYEAARDGFRFFPFSFLFCGLNIFTSALFTALSNGRLSALLSFLRTFGALTAFLLALPALLGVTGVWLAVPAAELLTSVAAAALLRRNKARYHYA